MAAARDTTTTLRLHRHLRRRRCLTISTALLLLLALTLTLSLLLLRPRSPTATLLSASLTGAGASLSFPSGNLSLNLTLDLTFRVHNPNPAAFSHAPTQALLLYRSAIVGTADVAPGRVPARGNEDVSCKLKVEAERIAADTVAELAATVAAGEVEFDVTARVPGRVSFLGVIKHHAVVVFKCHVVVGFPDLRLRSRECSDSL